VLTKGEIYTLVNIVIVDPTRAYFSDLAQFKDLLLLIQLKQKKNLLRLTPHRSIPPSSSKQIGYQCVFTWLCQCYLEPKRVRRPSHFCLGYFFSSHNFNYVAKHANILHFKLGNSTRPSYFLNANPSWHTPHCYGWPITSCWLLRWRVFWHLVCTNLTSFKLSLVFNTSVHFLNVWCVL
jgi:hypothetical protein